GKTNMDEFAMGTSTETSYFGPTKNPWNLERVPGGSSGGSAAAVAAGMAPLSLGSDTGGSIRCPASFCGVVGLKPTYGLVSRYGLIAYANSLEQIGPIAFNTRDCSLLLSVIAGRDLRDSTTLSVEAGSYDGALGGDLKGFKVGLVKELMGEGTHPAVVEALQRFAGKLEELGAWIGKVSLPILEYALPAYYIIAMSEASSNLARYDGIRYGFRAEGEGLDWSREFSVTRSLGFGSEVKRRIILGTYALSAGYYDRFFLKAVKVATMIRRSLTESFKKFSLLLAPTMPLPPFRLGEKISDPLALYMCDIDTVPVNLAGVPAISVPCGFHEGLPLGAQLIAPPLGEGRLLKAAEAYEKAAPEMFKRPPLG
ncbi:MAG: Asp-tRNA(Asn)/Glu-tRNA(Gln) amidotransferase subunit GatA, partial [Candidatus Hecatellaceae archaeon]